MQERVHRVTVRFTEPEYQHIKEELDVAGISLSEYLRARTLGKRVASKADLKVLAELRRIGGLLKYVHLETRGVYSVQTAEAIKAITEFVRTLSNRQKKGEPVP